MTPSAQPSVDRFAARAWTRWVSLAAALALSAVLMIYPRVLGSEMTAMTHTALPLLMLGVSAAFVHGIGFRVEGRILRVVFSPFVAWPLIVVGLALLAHG